jgi:uncharacterized protein YndB with AHSA1/START domain
MQDSWAFPGTHPQGFQGIMKRIAPALLATAAILAVIVLGGGFLLPNRWHVSRSIIIEAEPEAVFPLIEDLSQWRHWTVWNRLNYHQLRFESEGSSRGLGAAQVWEDEELGELHVKITQCQPPRRVDYEQQFGKEGKVVSGQFSLRAQTEGTEVTWTQTGQLGGNPLARWVGLLFLDSMIGADAARGLEQLKERVELGE